MRSAGFLLSDQMRLFFFFSFTQIRVNYFTQDLRHNMVHGSKHGAHHTIQDGEMIS